MVLLVMPRPLSAGQTYKPAKLDSHGGIVDADQRRESSESSCSGRCSLIRIHAEGTASSRFAEKPICANGKETHQTV